MKTIKLACSDSVAIVDDEDFDRINAFRWHLGCVPGLENIPVTVYHRKNMKHKHFMHHLVMNVPKDTRVANLSGDYLDCQKANLQLTDHSMLLHSSARLYANNKTGYRGVNSYQKRPGDPIKFKAQIRVRKVTHAKRGFLTPEAANQWVQAKKKALIDDADLVKYTRPKA